MKLKLGQLLPEFNDQMKRIERNIEQGKHLLLSSNFSDNQTENTKM